MSPIDRKIARPRPARAEMPVSRAEFDSLKTRVDEVAATLDRLRQDYAIQVVRAGQLQAAIHRLTQAVQALTASRHRPPAAGQQPAP